MFRWVGVQLDDALSILSEDPATTGFFCDFDGTLAAIVDRPGDATPVPGAVEVLERLAAMLAVVAVVSGRSLDDLRRRCAPAGVLLAGSYGRERAGAPPTTSPPLGPLLEAAEAAAAEWKGVVVEPKRTGVALHYRLAPERAADVDRLASSLAGRFALERRPGRLVVELVEPGPGKAEAMAAMATEHRLRTVAVAGDDAADLEAFHRIKTLGVRAVAIGVRSPEAPPGLVEGSDVVVAGPDELVRLLGRLA